MANTRKLLHTAPFNNIINAYRGNPNYYCSVSCGTSVTLTKDDLLERETPLCAVSIF